LLSDLQRYLLRGTHHWEAEPDEEDGAYIAGMDVGGEDRPKPGDESKPTGKRDSTVITIGRVRYNELDLPRIEVVHQVWWTGMRYMDQYAAAVALMQQWNIRRLVIDRTGLGEGLAALLTQCFGEERVVAFRFTRPTKSHLTYQMLSMINSGRLKMYQADEAPPLIYEEAWKQLRLARYRIPAQEMMDRYVDAGEGHDDFLMSIALLTEALASFTAPPESGYVRPRKMYEGESRY
jgi:hypothetical protein